LTPKELVLPFRGFYLCANFGENRSRNATVRVLADGQTDRLTDTLTDANRFYNLSHAICYSYGTDKNSIKLNVQYMPFVHYAANEFQFIWLAFEYLTESCLILGASEYPQERHLLKEKICQSDNLKDYMMKE